MVDEIQFASVQTSGVRRRRAVYVGDDEAVLGQLKGAPPWPGDGLLLYTFAHDLSAGAPLISLTAFSYCPETGQWGHGIDLIYLQPS
jgi:hypothetical protein